MCCENQLVSPCQRDAFVLELSRAIYVARARSRADPFASWLLPFSLNLRLRIDRVTCRSLIWAGPELTPPSLTAEPSQALEWNIYGMRRRPGPSGLQPSPKGNNINKQKRKCFVNPFYYIRNRQKGIEVLLDQGLRVFI